MIDPMCKRATGLIILCSLIGTGFSHAPTASADGGEPYIGQVLWVPYNFAPVGWAFCDGQLLSISQNTALFSLLGTTYGGDGRTTFALPDMRGRLMNSPGQGPGLSLYDLGDSGGTTTHTLTPAEMPAHNHRLQGVAATADKTTPENNLHAQPPVGFQYGSNPNVEMSTTALEVSGGSQPHNNMMPYTTLNCIIALQGIFPPRP